MRTFDAAIIEERKKVFLKAQYIKRKWVTGEDTKMTLEEYAKYVDSTYYHVKENPIIIAKEKKDGTTFLKMAIPFSEGCIIEYDLSYESDFMEGDEIDVNTLEFCIEKYLDKEHAYATGNVKE